MPHPFATPNPFAISHSSDEPDLSDEAPEREIDLLIHLADLRGRSLGRMASPDHGRDASQQQAKTPQQQAKGPQQSSQVPPQQPKNSQPQPLPQAPQQQPQPKALEQKQAQAWLQQQLQANAPQQPQVKASQQSQAKAPQQSQANAPQQSQSNVQQQSQSNAQQQPNSSAQQQSPFNTLQQHQPNTPWLLQPQATQQPAESTATVPHPYGLFGQSATQQAGGTPKTNIFGSGNPSGQSAAQSSTGKSWASMFGTSTSQQPKPPVQTVDAGVFTNQLNPHTPTDSTPLKKVVYIQPALYSESSNLANDSAAPSQATNATGARVTQNPAQSSNEATRHSSSSSVYQQPTVSTEATTGPNNLEPAHRTTNMAASQAGCHPGPSNTNTPTQSSSAGGNAGAAQFSPDAAQQQGPKEPAGNAPADPAASPYSIHNNIPGLQARPENDDYTLTAAIILRLLHTTTSNEAQDARRLASEIRHLSEEFENTTPEQAWFLQRCIRHAPGFDLRIDRLALFIAFFLRGANQLERLPLSDCEEDLKFQQKFLESVLTGP